MKQNVNFRAIVRLAGMPALQLVLGLFLLLHPDGVVSLVFRILGWVMAAAALVLAFSMAEKSGNRSVGRILLALVLGGCGAFLIKNPLVLAVGTGKVIGILLLIRGVEELLLAGKTRQAGGSYILKYVFGGLTALAGIWLVLSPMAPSRLIFGLIGVGLIVAAVANLLSGKKDFEALAEPRNPNIIDADE